MFPRTDKGRAREKYKPGEINSLTGKRDYKRVIPLEKRAIQKNKGVPKSDENAHFLQLFKKNMTASDIIQLSEYTDQQLDQQILHKINSMKFEKKRWLKEQEKRLVV